MLRGGRKVQSHYLGFSGPSHVQVASCLRHRFKKSSLHNEHYFSESIWSTGWKETSCRRLSNCLGSKSLPNGIWLHSVQSPSSTPLTPKGKKDRNKKENTTQNHGRY